MKTFFAIATICFFSSLQVCVADSRGHMRKDQYETPAKEQPCANDPIKFAQCYDGSIGLTDPGQYMEDCCKQ